MIITSFLICAITVVTLMCIAFLIGRAKKNYSLYVDIVWGSGFAIIGYLSLFLSDRIVCRKVLITTLITLWSIRLVSYIVLRGWHKGEDKRYIELMQNWQPYPLLQIFLKIFMLQAVLQLIISAPVFWVNSTSPAGCNFLDVVGLGVWITGFLFEFIGDYQLHVFIQNPANKGKLMMQGLWRYTRHPNYFGEMTMWWGMWLIACSVPWGIFTIISPIIITLLLLFVSGVPLVEKQFETHPEFAEYKRRTSKIIPWFVQN